MRRVFVLAVAMVVMLALAPPASANVKGATQVAGVGVFDAAGECQDDVGFYHAAIVITGDMPGCLYQVWGPSSMKPSGTYFERGTETFVSAANSADRFETTYVFTGKFNDGDFGDEIFGRCQHPIVPGSGTGAFAGATGRLDFKDVIERDGDGNITNVYFPMRGHIRYSG